MTRSYDFTTVATLFLALCVLIERVIWWIVFKKNVSSAAQIKAREALGSGNFPAAWELSNRSNDPFVKNLGDGISHAHTSMLAAMQLDATHWIEKSEARMWVLGTIITLAPLLGLLGTVSGMEKTFESLSIQAGEKSMEGLAGGISEVLVATESGLAVAIPALLLVYVAHRQVHKHVQTLNLIERHAHKGGTT